ncbi:MAG: hypothetical protein ABI781_11250 [Burkholderiales bacterium]
MSRCALTLAFAAAVLVVRPVFAEPQKWHALPGKPVADRSLAQQRGGTDGGSATTLTGTVSANQAINVTSGGNVIGGGAFAGAAGVPVVIQNSGSNVLIQSSVVVNLQLK